MSTASHSDSSSVANDLVIRYYDATLDLYEGLIGGNIHHGYWEPGTPPGSADDRADAADRLVRVLAEYGGVTPQTRVLDVGCGIGGPAIILARELNCRVEGITLSAAQVHRATEKAVADGVADRTRFREADYFANDYSAESFNVVWSLESMLHLPVGPFLAEAARLLRPGGTVVIGMWCSREELTVEERSLLRRTLIAQAAIPTQASIAEVTQELRRAGFIEPRTADWSDRVKRSWAPEYAQFDSARRDPKVIARLARERGIEVYGFYRAEALMREAFDSGAMRYGVFAAIKAT
ncbi:methyltransferase domain-containing protein [Nocardia sp. NPDC101769]|uniref:methyltransferase domain-containing protein n=1 Tax=Nocardia sp. NPDC101769 TaxID=3364333 RepID=UPI00382839C0